MLLGVIDRQQSICAGRRRKASLPHLDSQSRSSVEAERGKDAGSKIASETKSSSQGGSCWSCDRQLAGPPGCGPVAMSSLRQRAYRSASALARPSSSTKR